MTQTLQRNFLLIQISLGAVLPVFGIVHLLILMRGPLPLQIFKKIFDGKQNLIKETRFRGDYSVSGKCN